MAEVQGANYKTVRQAGEYGNLNVAIMTAAFAAQAANDVLLLGQLAGSVRIVRAVAIADDLGLAQTLDVGYQYQRSTDGVDALDGLLTGLDTGTAASNNGADMLVDIADGCGVDITARNVGDVATGAISVIVYYEYIGQ